MQWRCLTCNDVVGDNDMVGYFKDTDGAYIPGTLGFWHNNRECGDCERGVVGRRGCFPYDTHVGDFKKNMSVYISAWLYDAQSDEFRRDCSIFISRCYQEGYEETFRLARTAVNEGIIDTNLPPDLLWPSQVQTILEWKKRR